MKYLINRIQNKEMKSDQWACLQYSNLAVTLCAVEAMHATLLY